MLSPLLRGGKKKIDNVCFALHSFPCNDKDVFYYLLFDLFTMLLFTTIYYLIKSYIFPCQNFHNAQLQDCPLLLGNRESALCFLDVAASHFSSTWGPLPSIPL